ncbi:hypothetical protein [Saccharomonospora azurea]|uniref:hypothetical protein n=1 Tax=Saccharomonospora azurea TaxID=40988 RepID=UPI0030C6B0BD
MFAVWRVGAVFAPANYRLTSAELTGLAELTRPSALVCHVDYAEHADAVSNAADLRGGTLWVGADAPASDTVAGVAVSGSPQPDDVVPPGHRGVRGNRRPPQQRRG